MKSLFRKYLIYTGLKFLIYYGWNFGFATLDWDFSDFQRIVLGIIMLGILPVVDLIFLSYPSIWLVQKIKEDKNWLPLLGILFIAEFAISVWVTQNQIQEHHLIKLAISVIVFAIVFMPDLKIFHKEKAANRN